jgi:hypothetical protein
VELVDNHRANCPPQGKDDARHRRSGLFSSSFPSSWLMIATPSELVASNGRGICHFIDRIKSGGWGFPIPGAAAFMRALRLSLSE